MKFRSLGLGITNKYSGHRSVICAKEIVWKLEFEPNSAGKWDSRIICVDKFNMRTSD